MGIVGRGEKFGFGNCRFGFNLDSSQSVGIKIKGTQAEGPDLSGTPPLSYSIL